jgi:3-dehydroquinate synthase
MQHMAVDKKVMDGVVRLVLLKNIGEAVISSTYEPENLQATLRNFCNIG